MAVAQESDLKMDQVAGIVFSMIDAYNVIVDGQEPRNRWDLLNEDEQAAAINACTALRDAPEITPEKNHENWVEVMESRGWSFGEELDLDTRAHPNMVPFADLSIGAKRMSYAIYLVVTALARPIEEVVGSVR